MMLVRVMTMLIVNVIVKVKVTVIKNGAGEAEK